VNSSHKPNGCLTHSPTGFRAGAERGAGAEEKGEFSDASSHPEGASESELRGKVGTIVTDAPASGFRCLGVCVCVCVCVCVRTYVRVLLQQTELHSLKLFAQDLFTAQR